MTTNSTRRQLLDTSVADIKMAYESFLSKPSSDIEVDNQAPTYIVTIYYSSLSAMEAAVLALSSPVFLTHLGNALPSLTFTVSSPTIAAPSCSNDADCSSGKQCKCEPALQRRLLFGVKGVGGIMPSTCDRKCLVD